MPAAIVRRTDIGFSVQVEVPYHDSMLEAEDGILKALNEAGVAATEEAKSAATVQITFPPRPIRAFILAF